MIRVLCLAVLLSPVSPLVASLSAQQVTVLIEMSAEARASVEEYRRTQRVVFVDSQRVVDATNASPIVIEVDSLHGYESGSRVRVSGVKGNIAGNGEWTITKVDGVRFSLDGSRGNGAFTPGTAGSAAGRDGELRRVPKEDNIAAMLRAILLEKIHNEMLEAIPTAAVRQRQQELRQAGEALREEKRRATMGGDETRGRRP